ESVVRALNFATHYYLRRDEDGPPLDPRWLDVAVQLKHLGLIRHFARPGHAAANTFLGEAFRSAFNGAKSVKDCAEVVATMTAVAHPEAADAFLAVAEKYGGTATPELAALAHVIPQLPRAALPRLETLLPKLDDRVADSFLYFIQELRSKA